MNQAKEESAYYPFEEEEEAIDVNCLLVEPRSDQVSVSSVWCYEEDNLPKCIKTENDSYNSGVVGSNVNMQGLDTANLNGLDVMPHEVGVENFLTTSNVSPCDDYLLDFGFDHGACMGYVSNSQFPVKGSFGIQNSLTETISGTECQIFDDYTKFGSKSLDRFDDFSKSFVTQDNIPPQNGLELVPFSKDGFSKDGTTGTSPTQDHGVGTVANKRSRKPTKRYIDESSVLSMKNAKKRREACSGSKVKPAVARRVKSQSEVKPKVKEASPDISFDKAIQVPFISQGPIECQKTNSPAKVSPPAKIEKRVVIYSSGSEDDSETMTRSMTGGSQRKLHRLWTVAEVKKLIDGVAHFGVGKWTHIKKLLFSSSVHRSPVDLKDKWRNLLKASHTLEGSMIEDDQKRSQPWRPLPKSVLCRVRELASVYPYPREANSKMSKTKVPIGIKSSSKVPVV